MIPGPGRSVFGAFSGERAMAEEMILQAIKRAYEERGVKIQIVPEY